MNRIDLKFKELKEKGKKAMIPFITAGDPDLSTTIELAVALEAAGADILELGIPYSDPLADGPIIQASSQRAIESGARISRIMETSREIRRRVAIPLLYLVYYNSIFKYGIEKFIKEASDSGIDGLIIPDLPIEEREELIQIADVFNIYLIPLVAPTSKDRIAKIVKGGKGFIYCVSVAGVTGVRDEINTDIEQYLELVGQYSSLPKALGFGISSAEMAEKYSHYCEGIIVGSAVIKRIASGESNDEKVSAAAEFVREIKAAL